MKYLIRLSREAKRYAPLYLIGILCIFCLSAVNLAAPRVLSAATGIVQTGVDSAALERLAGLSLLLVALYLLRVVFRFLSNYLLHKAAWNLVGDVRVKVYGKLQSLDLSYFHDKQTGDLMSRVSGDTRDFELLYAHILPELVSNLVTFFGVLIILLTINAKLALITCAPLPLIAVSGYIFVKKVRPHFRVAQKKMG